MLRTDCRLAIRDRVTVHLLFVFALTPTLLPAQAIVGPELSTVQVPSSADPGAAKPPFPNRANELLPAWLRLRGEFRLRPEGFDGGGFDETREDLYWLSRFRIGAAMTPSRHLGFQLQVQDARVAKKTEGPTGPPFRAPFDLRMAFADVGSARGPITVRVGRQELAYGEQRLVGHGSWLNAARTFDGVKTTFRTRRFLVDAFGTSVVRTLDNEFDKSGHGNQFAGVYATSITLVPKAAVDSYLFRRRDVDLRTETAGVGDLGQTTAGVRIAGVLPAWLHYSVEMAMQRGSLGQDDVRAWAGHWQIRHALRGAGAVRLTGEYNYASGDEDPTDGVRGTFDQLYPTPHDKYGLADQVGWKNIHHVRAGTELTPLKALTVSANYHSWWLAERRDGLYTAGGALLARVAAGAAARHVGHELDVQLARPLTPQLQLAAGYAHIFPGRFLAQATPGASYRYPYVMLTYVFLAEK